MQSEHPARFLCMQPLHHPSIQHRDTPSGSSGGFPGCHNSGGFGSLLGRDAEDLVGGRDLLRVDQRLSVESKRLALPAGRPKSFGIPEVGEYAIQYIKTNGPGREDAVAESR